MFKRTNEKHAIFKIRHHLNYQYSKTVTNLMRVCDMFSAFLNDTRFPPLISMYETNHRTDAKIKQSSAYILNKNFQSMKWKHTSASIDLGTF